MLFDETSLRKLQQLTLVTSRVRAGALRGERRSLKRGAGLEFADFRDYVPGDDLRRVDWKKIWLFTFWWMRRTQWIGVKARSTSLAMPFTWPLRWDRSG